MELRRQRIYAACNRKVSMNMATTGELEIRLNGHEDLCSARFAKIELQFDATNARLKRLEQVVMGTAATIILLLLGIVIKLVGLS